MTFALHLLMIVDDPAIAAFVASNGVDRLFVDLEVMGKAERQGHLDTVQSVQSSRTVTRVREAAPDAHLLVRINPMHDGSRLEIDDVIARGADSVMLPMFHDAQTLARFLDLLDGRAEALPLVETVGALNALPEIAATLPVTQVHIGLNDLHLERGDRMMFAPLADGSLETACAALRAQTVRFGIGGLARAGEGHLPPELLLGEHVRLGSSAAILSRSFHRRAASLQALQTDMDFTGEVARLQDIYAEFQTRDGAYLEANRATFAAGVMELAANARAAT
jgi:2-keto-3-deoxy-L-rhamnonate aldolase RhmA